jgi:Trk K+ transport system NAD-binding subunit
VHRRWGSGNSARVLWTEPFVICGFGEVGSTVARCAVKAGRHPHQVTVVERDAARARRASDCGYRVVAADARSAPVLHSAGAGVAARIVVCLGHDRAAETVRAARSLAPNAAIHVVLAGSGEGLSAMQAGADGVLSISKLGGKLLADAALRLLEENHASERG